VIGRHHHKTAEDSLNTDRDNPPSPFVQVLQKAVEVRPHEVRALVLSFLYYFLVLSSYYIIRPIRDDFGTAGGLDNLPYMFTATLVVMLIANALFSALVARFTRRRFIPIAYRFLLINLLIFAALLLFIPKEHQVWVGRAFFVWTSVFNLFVVSVFWAFVVDVFDDDQGKRLFGFVSVGGTLGAILGSLITGSLVRAIGAVSLLLISAALLELASQCVRLFPAPQPAATETRKEADRPVGGGMWAGLLHNFSSPYLLGICAYMLLYSLTSTLLYSQQVGIVGAAIPDRLVRTAFFARVDLVVNILTVIAQIFITGRLLKWFGVGLTLALLPLLTIVGFTGLGFVPSLGFLIVFLTLRRAGNFAFARPARENLFTVISREDKYKSNNFIDTVVYRVGDQVGIWTPKALTWLGLSLTGVSFVAAPIGAVWLVVSLWLGRRQSAMADRPVEIKSVPSA